MAFVIFLLAVALEPYQLYLLSATVSFVLTVSAVMSMAIEKERQQIMVVLLLINVVNTKFSFGYILKNTIERSVLVLNHTAETPDLVEG